MNSSRLLILKNQPVLLVIISYSSVVLVYLSLLFSFNKSLFTNLKSTYGLSDTDTEGTLWWLWNQSQSSQISNISGGNIFDTSQFTFWNLFDFVRIFSVGNFGVENLFLISNVSLLISFSLNGIAAFAFSKLLFKGNLIPACLGSIFVFTSINLLSLRTSLSNNFLFFGLLLLRTFLSDFMNKKKRNTYLVIALSVFTALSSTYLAANIILITFVFILVVYSSTTVDIKRRLIINFLLTCLASLITTLIIYRDQIFLIGRSQQASEIRPLNAVGELVSSQVTISNKFQAPSGFLSLTIVVILLLATYLSFGRLKLTHQTLLSLGVLISGLVTQFIGYNFWVLGPIHDLYFNLFPQLRGISNYSKFGQFLIAVGAVSLIYTYRPKLLNAKVNFVFFCAAIAILSAYQSIPADPSFTARTDTRVLKSKYLSYFETQQNSLVFDYPDKLTNDQWGFPLGYIQLGQIFHKQILLNGVDYNQHKAGCISTNRLNPTNIIEWVERNHGNFIILRTRLIPKEELNEVRSILSQRNWQLEYESKVQAEVPTTSFELSKTFEVYKNQMSMPLSSKYVCNYNVGDSK